MIRNRFVMARLVGAAMLPLGGCGGGRVESASTTPLPQPTLPAFTPAPSAVPATPTGEQVRPISVYPGLKSRAEFAAVSVASVNGEVVTNGFDPLQHMHSYVFGVLVGKKN